MLYKDSIFSNISVYYNRSMKKEMGYILGPCIKTAQITPALPKWAIDSNTGTSLEIQVFFRRRAWHLKRAKTKELLDK